MTKERKKLILYLIAVIILFSGGLGLGYYIWGMDKQKKLDYKKYLSKTIDYIGNIEKDNRGYIKQAKRLKADIAALKKDVKDAQAQFDAQSKSLHAKTVSFEKEKEQLQAKIDQLINELKKEPAEHGVQSHADEKKVPLEEKGQLEKKSEKLPD